MSGRAFLDTNILVYLFDTDSPAKQARARRVLSEHGRAGTAVVSTQVLQEFYVTVTRKLEQPLSEEDAQHAVEQLTRLPVVQIDTTLVRRGIARSQASQVSLWDALVIEAARDAGCEMLLTEDLHSGWKIDQIEIVNPFKQAPSEKSEREQSEQ